MNRREASITASRTVYLDLNTTGLEVDQGHRIIEIGTAERIDADGWRFMHGRLNPGRPIDPGAAAVHGIESWTLQGQPGFAEIAGELLERIRGADLVMRNAAFRVGFLDAELRRLGPAWGTVADHCHVTCLTALARQRLPGVKTSLGNLCAYFGIPIMFPTALIDAHLVAAVHEALLRRVPGKPATSHHICPECGGSLRCLGITSVKLWYCEDEQKCGWRTWAPSGAA
ncbi:MAG TPA: exonuclease domain-containing protein [Gammaproteobacteria bacterium]|nr:exonuclease domain-containing protein [Gammaproteobacteria bacterium]